DGCSRVALAKARCHATWIGCRLGEFREPAVPTSRVTRMRFHESPAHLRRHRLLRLRLWGRRREGERYPQRPTLGAVLRGNVPVGSDAEEPLHLLVDREDVAHLRTDPDGGRLEGAEPRARAAVAGNLLVEIASDADIELLAE